MDQREEYTDYGGLVPSPSYRSSMSGYASQYTGNKYTARINVGAVEKLKYSSPNIAANY